MPFLSRFNDSPNEPPGGKAAHPVEAVRVAPAEGRPEVAGRVPVVVPQSARRLAMTVRFGLRGRSSALVGAEPPTSQCDPIFAYRRPRLAGTGFLCALVVKVCMPRDVT